VREVYFNTFFLAKLITLLKYFLNILPITFATRPSALTLSLSIRKRSESKDVIPHAKDMAIGICPVESAGLGCPGP
jgi:hypothetical protein